MSDDTMPEAPASRSEGAPGATTDTARVTTGTASAEPAVADSTLPSDPAAPGEGSGGGPDGAPKRRRRRGSRGGRNRKRPAGASGSAPATDDDAGDDDEEDVDAPATRLSADRPSPSGRAPRPERRLPQSYNDAEADRGLTDDDVAVLAREEAGLPEHGSRVGDVPAAAPVAPRPQIGDSRPAPVSTPTEGAATNGASTAPRRRRRRGGRGRNRSGAGTTGGGGQGGAAKSAVPADGDDVVRADLGFGDEPAVTLDAAARERRRGRTRKGRPAGRYLMCVHALEGGHTHIAVLEGRSLVEHTLATPSGDDSIDGNIYLGRVQNVLPGMEAAFVDIATPKNGVLYRGDVAFDKSDVEGGGGKPKIERMLKNGQLIVVQVTKNPIAHKGARLTQEVSLAGRFLVMVPGEPETYGISKRLPDDERKRLRRILDGLRPADAGLIVRTAAEGATQEELERDVRRLRSQWEQISELAAKTKSAKLLYQEPDLVLRLIREEFTKEYRGVVIDDRELYERTRSYVEAVAPELAERVEFYDEEVEGLPIFERFHIQEQLVKALDRKVWLPSGGSLVIERTEALTVIDVNTGKNVGKSNLEETVFRNNLEAAEEIARQLRLRDIGGIIVIDFIDMEIKANRDETMRVFRDALARDKTRTQAFEMSELGLVEMTRKRISEGLVESFSETCPTCHGRGFLLDEELLSGVT
jgi:ribonuclease E